MARLTLIAINAAVKAAGIDAQLVKGQGYYYFTGPEVERCKTTTVYAMKLAHCTLDDLVKLAHELKTEHLAQFTAPGTFKGIIRE